MKLYQGFFHGDKYTPISASWRSKWGRNLTPTPLILSEAEGRRGHPKALTKIMFCKKNTA